MGKAHVLERDKIKPGDTVKLVDTLTLEERAEVDALRALGDSGILDIKATMLEELAGSARKRANAAKLFETYPSMFPELAPKPGKLVTAQVVLMSLVLVGMVVLAVGFSRIKPPTLPASTAPLASDGAPNTASLAPSSEKGRAGRVISTR